MKGNQKKSILKKLTSSKFEYKHTEIETFIIKIGFLMNKAGSINGIHIIFGRFNPPKRPTS